MRLSSPSSPRWDAIPGGGSPNRDKLGDDIAKKIDTESQTNTEIGSETIKSKCVDLPVYLRYELSLPVVNKFLEPFVAAGPQWSWNIGDKTFSLTDMLPDGGQEALSQYTLRSSNLSLNLGLGAVVLNHVQLHVNYNIALGSTSEYSEPTQAALNFATKSKTNTWQFSLAYIF